MTPKQSLHLHDSLIGGSSNHEGWQCVGIACRRILLCQRRRKDRAPYQKKYLYDLQGVGDEVRIALFDPDGFVIIRRGDLHGAWGDGYFPSGIKVYADYLTRSGFEKLQKPD